MKETKLYIALLATGLLIYILGEANKPTYVVAHKVPLFQVVLIAIGLAATILLILYVIARVWARRINKVRR